jgi:carbon-monoxide dehydrogenase large subunit
VRIEPSGKILLASGACPQGQGMETIFAQVVADAWSVDPDDVVVSLADTAAIPMGFGTIASRSTVTLSAAIHHASEAAGKTFAVAANLLNAARRIRAARRHGGRHRRARHGGTAGQGRASCAPGWITPARPGRAGLGGLAWEPPTVT